MNKWGFSETWGSVDVTMVAAKMHPKTTLEVCTLTYKSPYKTLKESIKNSYDCVALTFNNKVFGFSGIAMVDTIDIVWLITDDSILDHPFGFIKAMKRIYYPLLLKRSKGTIIGQFIDCRFPESIKLFSNNGLKPTDIIHNFNGVPFQWCVDIKAEE